MRVEAVFFIRVFDIDLAAGVWPRRRGRMGRCE